MDTIERALTNEFDFVSRIVVLGASKDLDSIGGFRLVDRPKFIHVFASESLRVARNIEDQISPTQENLVRIAAMRRQLFDLGRSNAPVMDRIYKRLVQERLSVCPNPMHWHASMASFLQLQIRPEHKKFFGDGPFGHMATDSDVVPCPWAREMASRM